jgi:hypothetical protein
MPPPPIIELCNVIEAIIAATMPGEIQLRDELYAVAARLAPRTWPQGESMEPQKPTIGRIVHYTNLGDRDGKYPPTVQAAIVTGVNDDGTVALHVFYKTGQFDLPSAKFSDAQPGSEQARGCWGWPPRA